MIKRIITIVSVVAIFTILSQIIPDTITGQIDGALIYFLSFLWNLNNILDVSTLISCFQVIINFIFGVCIFWIFHYILILTTSD